MINSDKKPQEKYCTCKKSKCIKLYCECFAAHRPCCKHCRCINCHNGFSYHSPLSSYANIKRQTKQEKGDPLKNSRGCACRKSNCTKKYCQCFQAGLMCIESCKCIDCQNNDFTANKNVVNQLKKNSSELSNQQMELYPLNLSQNSEELNKIMADHNPLSLRENWVEGCAKELYETAKNGSTEQVLDSFIEMLKSLEENIGQDKRDEKEEQEESDKVKLQEVEVKQQF